MLLILASQHCLDKAAVGWYMGEHGHCKCGYLNSAIGHNRSNEQCPPFSECCKGDTQGCNISIRLIVQWMTTGYKKLKRVEKQKERNRINLVLNTQRQQTKHGIMPTHTYPLFTIVLDAADHRNSFS